MDRFDQSAAQQHNRQPGQQMQHHAYLNIHSGTGSVAVRLATRPGAEVGVDGERLSDQGIHVLNRPASRVAFAQFAYQSEYVRFSYSATHRRAVHRYSHRRNGGIGPCKYGLAYDESHPLPFYTKPHCRSVAVERNRNHRHWRVRTCERSCQRSR